MAKVTCRLEGCGREFKTEHGRTIHERKMHGKKKPGKKKSGKKATLQEPKKQAVCNFCPMCGVPLMPFQRAAVLVIGGE